MASVLPYFLSVQIHLYILFLSEEGQGGSTNAAIFISSEELNW